MFSKFAQTALLFCLLPTSLGWAQQLSPKWEELTAATAARGAALRDVRADGIAKAIAFVKADTAAPRLQQEFFEKSDKPLDTKQ